MVTTFIQQMRSQMGLPKSLLHSAQQQLAHDLTKLAPTSFRRFVEPMVGDMSFYFDLYRQGRIKKRSIFVGEDAALVVTYCQVRKKAEEVVKGLEALVPSKSQYKRLSSVSTRKKPSPADAVRFIFLKNFLTANGDGVADPENVYAVSEALQNSTLLRGEPYYAEKYIRHRDLVFLQPGDVYDVEEFFEQMAVRGAYVLLVGDKDQKEKWHRRWDVKEVGDHRVVRSWND